MREQKIHQQAFSLIEVLVVVAVIGVIGVIMVDLLFRTISGGNKTQTIGNIQQNGQTVLNNMQTVILASGAVVCPTGTANSPFLVVLRNGVYNRFRILSASAMSATDCGGAASNPGRNGCIEMDTPQIDPTQGVQTVQTQIATFCSTADLSANNLALGTTISYLTDLNNVSVVGGNYFSDNSSNGFKDVVGIDFKLGPGSSVGNTNTSPVEFSTSVELR